MGLGRDLDGPRAQHLSLARTTRVRDLLAAEAQIDASRIRVAGAVAEAPAGAGRSDSPRRIGSACVKATRRPLRVGADTPAAPDRGRRAGIDP